MGKLYDEVQKEIQNINEIGNKKDLKSLLAKDLSKSKINYLFSLVNKYYDDNNPNLIHQKLSLENQDNLKTALNEAEAFIDKDDALILNEYHSMQTPDLAFLDNAYTSEYDHFVVLDTVVKETMKLHYDNLNPNDNNPHAGTKDIILAFQSEADKLINGGNQIIEFKPTDAEYLFIKEFINNPAKSFVMGNNKIFKFESTNERNLFIRNVDNTAAKINSLKNIKNEFNFNNFIKENLKRTGSFGAEELAESVIHFAEKYQDDYVEMQHEHPEVMDNVPTYGELLYKMKERVTYLVLKDNMELSVDYPSVFLKKFLDNPTKAMIDYYDAKVDNYRAGKMKDPVLDKVDDKNDIDALIRKANAKKVNAAIAKEKYDELSEDKVDKWKEYQNFKSRWFLNHFKANYDNLTIKATLEKNKGGFFENFFGTTSKEYKAFSKGLEDMIEDGTGKGDFDGLKKLTQNYLVHKLKHYDVFLNGYDDREIEKLDSTSRGRVMLCLSVLQSIQEAENSVAGKLDPDKFVAPDLDAPEAHDEYWQQSKEDFMKSQLGELNEFQKGIKEDSEMDNDKLNEAILDIDIKDLADDNDLDNSK